MPAKLNLALVAVWLAGLAGVPATFAQSGDVAVVVSPKNSVDHVSSQELRRIFAGERRSWTAGLPVKIIVRAPGAHERIVLLKLLGMSESEYKQYSTQQVFRGEAQEEPPALFSNGMQREALVVYPGAVALVDAQDVKPGMKVLNVDGRMPGESGYALK